jgi:membrane protease YdiL (CAAX protease family)
MREIFFNERDQFRSGWRVAIFVLVVIASSVLMGALQTLLVILLPPLAFLVTDLPVGGQALGGRHLAALIFNESMNIGIALMATAFCAWLLERRTVASVGYRLHRGWFRDFSLGTVIGGLTIAGAVGIIYASGAVAFAIPANRELNFAVAFLCSFLFIMLAAAKEELLFRGFAFQALRQDAGPVVALILTSVPFGLLHLFNPNATIFSTINTILAGIWLGLAYLATRSLWLATALHYSWNFVQAIVFGLPVSGLVTVTPLAVLRATPGPPRWLSGLEYGPEGGVAATVMIVVSTLVIWKAKLFTVSGEMTTVNEPDLQQSPGSAEGLRLKDLRTNDD